MARSFRIKIINGIYHIIFNGMSEILLYNNNSDKNKYMELIKKYQTKFHFKVYAYCLMSTHGHLIIDSNGADVSQFMHDINQSYAQYYNSVHRRNGKKRKGHVFRDRFKSKIIDTDHYLLTLSAYIHKNPKDIKKYRNCIEKYKHSSLAVYLGLRSDPFNVLDEDYIMQFFNTNVKKARANYTELVYNCTDKLLEKSTEFKDEKTEYRSERHIVKRTFSPEEILTFLSEYTGMPKWQIVLKNKRRNTKNKALYVLMLKCLRNSEDSEVCKILGNITQSRISALCSMGIDIVLKDNKYKNIIDDFLASKAS
ncbi:transposase [Haloimpatiens sp. FM7330]|uniref:transposase n=1 Tax=Haloimpatiens sp. FM7330 TaxID=3298610 RepID=UPI003642EE54